MRTNAPRSIEDYVLDFCHSIVPDGTPEYLPVEPASHAHVNECYPAVEEMVRNQGGSIWWDPRGSLHDITPKPFRIDRILFLPDPRRRYDGRQVNNIRRGLMAGREVLDFIAAADAEFELMNRGERADQHGRIDLSVREQMEYQSVVGRKMLAFDRMVKRQPPLGRNEPCPCGSGQKFKKCHGK